jgi:hypothetical protein
MNIVEHVFWLYVEESFGYMPRSPVAVSSGNTMSNFQRNYQTDCQSGCTSLQSHEKWRSISLSPHHHSICCHLNFWSQPFWLVWGGISVLLLCQRSSDHRCVGSFLSLQFYSFDLPACLCTMQFYHYYSVIQLEVRDGYSPRSFFFNCWEYFLLYWIFCYSKWICKPSQMFLISSHCEENKYWDRNASYHLTNPILRRQRHVVPLVWGQPDLHSESHQRLCLKMRKRKTKC